VTSRSMLDVSGITDSAVVSQVVNCASVGKPASLAQATWTSNNTFMRQAQLARHWWLVTRVAAADYQRLHTHAQCALPRGGVPHRRLERSQKINLLHH